MAGPAVVAFLAVGLLAAAPAQASVEKSGYVTVSDGTRLKYTVDLPSAEGHFPVGFVYDAYCEGDGALKCNDPATAAELLAHGYAVLGVNVRGSGCSGGTFDVLQRREAQDGAAVVEWAAAQPWSDGHLGMFGSSYPGISQLGVAALRPPHLDAISPWHAVSDAYRDIAYPGGIFNTGFAALFSFVLQPQPSYRSALTAAENQDPVCARNVAEHAAAEPTGNAFKRVAQHPYDDAFWASKTPGAGVANIDVPVFGCTAWQDDETSDRQGDSYYNQLDPARTWIVASNGYHGMCDTPSIASLLPRFFDRFVKGTDNGFEATPHVQIWHEARARSSQSTAAPSTDQAAIVASDDAPRWITTFPSWNVPVHPSTLYFRRGGVLSAARPSGMEPSDRYGYPLPGASSEDGLGFGQNGTLWKAPVAPAGALPYTTPRLGRDAEFFGTGSADLWLASTAGDTDLQITLTEVRPDGQELYIERGWLRASQRKLDPARSTALLPYQTHARADAQPLAPGRPTHMRVELFPSDHVFRAGSSIRLWIDAPTGVTGGWSLDFLKTPAINTILHDRRHPSKLVLGYLPGGDAHGTALPACDTLLNQPCRSNSAPVPSGTLTIGR